MVRPELINAAADSRTLSLSHPAQPSEVVSEQATEKRFYDAILNFGQHQLLRVCDRRKKIWHRCVP